MKISTLHRIARSISTDRRIHAGFGGTINQMTDQLKELCDGVRTRREAAKIIAMNIFDADEETAEAIAKDLSLA